MQSRALFSASASVSVSVSASASDSFRFVFLKERVHPLSISRRHWRHGHPIPQFHKRDGTRQTMRQPCGCVAQKLELTDQGKCATLLKTNPKRNIST
jgi:hypothetical protein